MVLFDAFTDKRLVLPQDVNLSNLNHVETCYKLKISYGDKWAIMNGLGEKFDFSKLMILTGNKPNENCVKFCVTLWRYIGIEQDGCSNVYTYRSFVMKCLTRNPPVSEDS